MVYTQVSESDFINLFHVMDRENNFSVTARRALFNYYDSLANDIGEDIELDIIGICCEWSESTEDSLIIEYIHLVNDEDIDEDDDDARLSLIVDYIESESMLIEVDQYNQGKTFLVLEF